MRRSISKKLPWQQPELSDQTFYFDLDADGEEEEISMLKGSGYLALDKNEDGIINDGSELFGTGNGDGFADLARYDEDGNGWIDENDSIWSKLKIWCKDENGNDVMDDAAAKAKIESLGAYEKMYPIKKEH